MTIETRRDTMIADAIILAQQTFGRDTIAALQGQWHADEERATLHFVYGRRQYWLAPWVGPVGAWQLGDTATNITSLLFPAPFGSTIDAATRLQTALGALWEDAALPHVSTVFDAIRVERERQYAKWGEQNHDPYTWLAILGEEHGELAQAILHDTFGGNAAGTMRKELVEVAAVAVQWLEYLERQAAAAEQEPA